MSSSSGFNSSLFVTADASPASALAESTPRARSETIADIVKLVNAIIGRIARQWQLSADEVADLRQEGYLAAIAADRSYNPAKAAWHTWLTRRVKGQLMTSIARLRGYGITGEHKNIYPISLDSFTSDYRSVDNDDEVPADPLTQVSGNTSHDTEVAAEIASAMDVLSKCLDDAEIGILSAYYGFDGPAQSVSQLGEGLGYSRKHAFTLLQDAQNSARSCLGVRS